MAETQHKKQQITAALTETRIRVKSRAERPLVKICKEVWKVSKPLIATYVAKLIVEQAKASEASNLGPFGSDESKTS
jgi:hypothetical protein